MKYENIQKAKLNVLESINVGLKIESITPLTMQGTQLKSNLAKAFNEGAMTTVVGVSNAIVEAAKLKTIDEQVHKFAHDCSEAINEIGIKAKLVYAFECIERRFEDVIQESALNTIDKLIVREDADITAAIRSGALSAFRSLPFIQDIIAGVAIVSENLVETSNLVVSKPISFVEVNEGTVFFRSANKVYGINSDKMQETSSPSNKFSYLSSIVEALSFDANENCFNYHDDVLGTFSISENGLSRKEADGTFAILENSEFIKSMNMIIESQSFTGKTGNTSAKAYRSAADALIAISENFDSIVIADNVLECFNKSNGDRVILVENSDAYHVAVVESVRLPKIVESFTNIKDALKVFEAKTTFDATSMFAEALTNQVQKDTAKTAAIVEQKAIVEGLQTRRNEVLTMIAENDNSLLQETLKELDVAIVENTNLYNAALKA